MGAVWRVVFMGANIRHKLPPEFFFFQIRDSIGCRALEIYHVAAGVLNPTFAVKKMESQVLML